MSPGICDAEKADKNSEVRNVSLEKSIYKIINVKSKETAVTIGSDFLYPFITVPSSTPIAYASFMVDVDLSVPNIMPDKLLKLDATFDPACPTGKCDL